MLYEVINMPLFCIELTDALFYLSACITCTIGKLFHYQSVCKDLRRVCIWLGQIEVI